MPYRPAQIWTGSAWDDIGDARVGVQPINTQTANYTLALSDIATRVQMNNSAARTITIPLNSSVNFPVGTRIDIANINTGVLTVAAASGATVNGRALTLGQWETATLVQRAANTWVLEQHADLTAALGSKLDLAGGKILQIVRATDTTARTTTSGSFVDVTGMSVTITPQKSNSAILLVASFAATIAGNNGYVRFRIADNSNNAISGGEQQTFGDGSSSVPQVPITLFAYATPATTSPVTYKLRFLSATGNTLTVDNANNTGQMYAIEVSA
jgi:hypothetical protein